VRTIEGEITITGLVQGNQLLISEVPGANNRMSVTPTITINLSGTRKWIADPRDAGCEQ